MNTIDIIRTLDVAVLKSTDTLNFALATAQAGKKLGFASICVRPDYVFEVSQLLGTKCACKVGTVIGFPLGYGPTISKMQEVEQALLNGATEFDMVMNLGYFQSKDYGKVEADIARIVSLTNPHTLKVILETCLWSKEEIVLACQLVESAGGDYVKTSTGFAAKGATREAVQAMMDTVGHRIGVKASGGIDCREAAESYLKMGCRRLGVGAQKYAEVLKEIEFVNLENYRRPPNFVGPLDIYFN